MADQKISQLTTIVTVDNASDLFPIVDTSAAETKKITPTALKTALALNNVDNTSDANKPVSSATQSALNAKQDTLVSGTNIKTINGTSVLGSGNIAISSAVAWGGVTGTLSNQTDLQTALDGKVDENTAITGATKTKITFDAKGLVTAGADLAAGDIPSGIDAAKISTGLISNAEFDYLNGLTDNIQTQFTGKQDVLVSATNIKTINSTSVLGSGNISVEPVITATTSADYYRGDKTFATLNKAAVGLGNVENTSDANKPVSTATQTALDAKTNKLVVTNRQTASYTLVLSDADKLVEMNVGSANNLTVPLNSSVAFSTGTQILLAQYGAGQTTIVATSGVTIRSNGAKLKLNAQYSGATLIKIAENEWYLFGDIVA
jgi:hypothetical protein